MANMVPISFNMNNPIRAEDTDVRKAGTIHTWYEGLDLRSPASAWLPGVHNNPPEIQRSEEEKGSPGPAG